MSTEKIKISEFLIQLAATICISFQGCQCGFICTWPSYTTALFTSNATVLSEPMTSTHISLLCSLTSVGALLISPFCGYVADTLGRKNSTVLFGLPIVLTWTIISVSHNVYLILLAMAVAGVGIGGQSVTGIFISEISHDSVRGGFTACSTSGFMIGILISNIMGGLLTYKQVVHSFLFTSVISVPLLLLLKESPVYLVLVGKEKEAAKSVSFYKRLKKDSKEVKEEILKIKQQQGSKLEPVVQEGYELVSGTENITSKEPVQQAIRISPWNFLKKSKTSQRALLKVLILMNITGMMGPIMLQVCAEFIFSTAVPSLEPNTCAVVVGLVFTLASLACVVAVDRCGRQCLLVYTATICGSCCILIGTILQFRWAPDWFTALLIYMDCFFFTMGCGPTPFILVAEVFLPEVRSLCNTIIMTSMWPFSFMNIASFNFLVEMLGLGRVFYVFSVISFAVAIYSRLCIPETKGMSMSQIQKLFEKKKVARTIAE